MTTSELAAQGRAVREAATALAQASNEQRCAVLLHVAERLEATSEELLAINADEVAAYDESGAGRDRLTLTPARVAAMAERAARDRRATPTHSSRSWTRACVPTAWRSNVCASRSG